MIVDVTQARLADIEGPALDLPSFASLGRPLTLGGFILAVAGRFGANDALVFDDPLQAGRTLRWTYSQLEEQCRRVARGLLATGIGKGARVATLMANRPEAVAAYFGAALAGAVVVPLSTFATRAELEVLIAGSDASVLLVQTSMGSHDYAADIAELIPPGRPQVSDPAYPHLREIVMLGRPGQSTGFTEWNEFLERGDRVTDQLVDAAAGSTSPSDLALVMFSSGTTAQPKGILHNHQAPTLQFWLQAELFGRHEGTRMWTALPIFWTAGMNTAMGATLAAGGCWVMQEGFDPGTALMLMAREQVTEPYSLPHQARALADHPDWPNTDLSSLRSVFGKSVFAHHPTVKGDPDWQMPVGWGMSETCAFVSAHPANSSREIMRSSLGRLLPGNRLKVIDPDTGAIRTVGEEGELVIKGPTMMEHYLGKTREQCFDRDGWYHTGDVGFVDDTGNVHWSGRRNEMIKSGGANISPAEIEVALRAFAPVSLARVIGMPDPRLEQVAVLCVERTANATVGEAEIIAFLRDRIASYKVPKRIVFFSQGEIPLTAGKTKVRDDALRQLVAARIGDSDDGAA